MCCEIWTNNNRVFYTERKMRLLSLVFCLALGFLRTQTSRGKQAVADPETNMNVVSFSKSPAFKMHMMNVKYFLKFSYVGSMEPQTLISFCLIVFFIFSES